MVPPPSFSFSSRLVDVAVVTERERRGSPSVLYVHKPPGLNKRVPTPSSVFSKLPSAILSRFIQSAHEKAGGVRLDKSVGDRERYTSRFQKFLTLTEVNPLKESELGMREVLLAYAEYVHSASFCPSAKKVNVKLGNVDLHLQFAAEFLRTFGFDDIRYVERSLRSSAKPRYFFALQKLRENIRSSDAPTESAVPLEHTLFERMHQRALRETDNLGLRRALLLSVVSFCYMCRSQSLSVTGKKSQDKRICFGHVSVGNEEELHLANGKFFKPSFKGASFCTLRLPDQKNEDVGEPRTRVGDFWISSALSLLSDMRSEGATKDTPLSDYSVNGVVKSVSARSLSKALRDFAESEGVVVRGKKRIASHSARASCAVLLLSLGYDTATVQLLGNWKSLDGLLPYIQTFSIKKLEELNVRASNASSMPTVRTGKRKANTFSQPNSPPRASSPESPLIKETPSPASTSKRREPAVNVPSPPSSSSSESDSDSSSVSSSSSSESDSDSSSVSSLEAVTLVEAPEPPSTRSSRRAVALSSSPELGAEISPSLQLKGDDYNSPSFESWKKPIWCQDDELPPCFSAPFIPLSPPSEELDFSAQTGRLLAAVFKAADGSRAELILYVGTVLGVEKSRGGDLAQEGSNVMVSWTDGSTHSLLLKAEEYLSLEDFHQFSQGIFAPVTNNARWYWAESPKD
jgi:hypothetical protein